MDKYQEVIAKLIDFRDKRDWKQFHNSKDLALALLIEAAERLFGIDHPVFIEKVIRHPTCYPCLFFKFTDSFHEPAPEKPHPSNKRTAIMMAAELYQKTLAGYEALLGKGESISLSRYCKIHHVNSRGLHSRNDARGQMLVLRHFW
ncbi:MAG: hypothetical protein AB2L24_22850 [Mangrovibacterium sp.]